MLKAVIQKLAVALLATALFAPQFASAASQVENQPKVIEKALQLEQKGILKQKHKGHLYLEVSKDFVTKLLPLIQTSGKIVPPWFVASKNGIGAHIEVIGDKERLPKKIKELGQEFTFTVKDVRSVKADGCSRAQTSWVLTVESPELEKLRESFSLSPKMKDRDFSIILGTQTPTCSTCPRAR